MKKRGQTTIEYLVTYGWVILTIIIAIGAISYFGLLDTQSFIPDRCWFGSQLVCEDFIIDEGPARTDVKFRVRNNFGKSIYIISIEGVDAKYPVFSCDSGVDIAVGASALLSCEASTATFFEGDKYSLPLKVNFRDNSSGADHHVVGEIFAKVL